MSGFGLYPWFFTGDASQVHPEDLEDSGRLFPYGKAFRLAGKGVEKYITLQYGVKTFRVVPELFKPIPSSPSFEIGQTVRTAKTGREGEIAHVMWHFKRQREYYLLKIAGKKDFSWCFEEDVNKI